MHLLVVAHAQTAGPSGTGRPGAGQAGADQRGSTDQQGSADQRGTGEPGTARRAATFGDSGALAAGALPDGWVPPVDWVPPVGAGVSGPVWFCGPEIACRQTVAGLGVTAPRVVEELAGPDLGAWSGRTLAEVLAEDPAGLQAWVGDADARPHGGESLTAFRRRIGHVLDATAWPRSGAVLVASGLTLRAALIHALDAPTTAFHHVDVPPLTTLDLSRHDGRWRLRALTPPARPATQSATRPRLRPPAEGPDKAVPTD